MRHNCTAKCIENREKYVCSQESNKLNCLVIIVAQTSPNLRLVATGERRAPKFQTHLFVVPASLYFLLSTMISATSLSPHHTHFLFSSMLSVLLCMNYILLCMHYILALKSANESERITHSAQQQ